MARLSHESYDVAIIGAGLGGLASGIFLAKQGLKVGVFEQPPSYHEVENCLHIRVVERLTPKKLRYALKTTSGFTRFNASTVLGRG